jgi:hypothetical protein
MKKLARVILTGAVFALALQLNAQDLPVGSHYPAGAEGIKGASLPPPGFYVRDYNYFLTADKVNGIPGDVDLFASDCLHRCDMLIRWKPRTGRKARPSF